MKLEQLIDTCQTRTEKLFNHYLNESPAPQLEKAMTYSVRNGGKRIRPLLVYAAGLTLNGSLDALDAPACAIEFIHAYSLIHDDLPAMDNADLRRGKPSCHKAYNEALAILAGDALQPLAFEVIASHPAPLTTEQRLTMIKILSHAAGFKGMAAGQTLDIEGTTSLNEMYNLKTGALLVASAQLGAIAANTQNPDILYALKKYAENVGLAFQVQDDLLDFESPENTGKPQGLDATNKKNTYPTLIGIEETQKMVQTLFSNALSALNILGEKANILRELAHYLMQRKK